MESVSTSFATAIISYNEREGESRELTSESIQRDKINRVDLCCSDICVSVEDKSNNNATGIECSRRNAPRKNGLRYMPLKR